MRIAVDIGNALDPGSGHKSYVESLLQALAEIDHENEFILWAAFWGGFPDRMRRMRLPDRFRVLAYRIPQRLLLPTEYFLRLPIQISLLKRARVDLYHGACGVLPISGHIKCVATMHHVGGDIEDKSWWSRLYYDSQTRATIHKADRLIAISESTRQTLITQYGVSPERVVRIYYGGAPSEFKAAPASLERLPQGIRAPFLLFVSSICERKNLEVLIEAFRIVKNSPEGKNHQLVFVGKPTSYIDRLRSLVHTLQLDGDVLFIDYLSPLQLNVVYRRASLLTYPSKLEGFGLPPLEAMACGTPVVASNATCLPEIIGDAGLLVDPNSPEQMAQAIVSILRDNDLSSELRARGFKRVNEFSWEKAARETLAVYRATCGS
jgi:glycosyltransferase involved in cell wall biosynthesis